MFRKEEPSIDSCTTISIVHQIYGLFRDGQPMCDTFAKSTMAWKAWCGRLGAKYILWDADMVDALMAKHADRESMWLYANARYSVQRCDVTHFLIMYVYIDMFPHRPTSAEMR